MHIDVCMGLNTPMPYRHGNVNWM